MLLDLPLVLGSDLATTGAATLVGGDNSVEGGCGNAGKAGTDDTGSDEGELGNGGTAGKGGMVAARGPDIVSGFGNGSNGASAAIAEFTCITRITLKSKSRIRILIMPFYHFFVSVLCQALLFGSMELSHDKINDWLITPA